MNLFCPECHAKFDDPSLRACPNDGTRLYRVDTSDPLIGTTIDGRFRANYILGAGGMGTVYGGVQLSVSRDVAIKVLRAELGNREIALERFFREAKTISKLSHPNIVKLIDFGQDRDRDLLYLVMELVRGESLGDVLGRGRLRAALALDVVYQVCGALTEPHADGVVHRDLKPDNLLITPISDGTIQVKVLDFGIARFMESNTQLTGTGMICGTPAYMAPEQAQNETLDARTDLYALGVILYEALSGWPPFSGTSSLQIMLKHISEAPIRLRDLLPPATLPAELEQFVYWLLEKDRKKRPQDAMEVRDRIDALRKTLDLAPVRMSRAESRESIDDFILPKLPRHGDDSSGPTQVLRRETGFEMHVVANDTAAEPNVGLTGPLTPDQKALVRSDLKVETRAGGQQAWTPQGADAIRAIKDTFEGVDVHAPTETSTPELLAPANQPQDVDSKARTTGPEGTRAKTKGREPVQTPMTSRHANDTPFESAEVTDDLEHPYRSGLSNRWLFSVAVTSVCAIAIAAYLINHRITTLTETRVAGEPPPLLVATPEPAVVAPVEVAPPHDLLNFVAARSYAERHVHRGIAASEQQIATDTSATALVKTSKKPVKPVAATKPIAPVKPVAPIKPVAEPEPQPSAPTSTDQAIQNLKLRQE